MSGFEKTGEDFLALLNESLLSGERAEEGRLSAPTLPTLLIVGAPRSGTTLLTQWLADLGFGVPTNQLARMFRAPYVGGLVQRLLTDSELNFRGELSVASGENFASEAGKTVGLLAPHEFFYFWREYLPLDVARPLTQDERSRADMAGLAAGLARLEAGLERALAMKAIIAQYDAALLHEHLPKAVFLHIVRDEVDNVESLLRIRERVHGSEEEWFSVRPSGSALVDSEPPVVQVAAQVAWTNDDLTRTLADIGADHSIRIDHSALCRDPAGIHDQIARTCAGLGYDVGTYSGPGHFDEHRRDSPRAAEILAALEYVRSMDRKEGMP